MLQISPQIKLGTLILLFLLLLLGSSKFIKGPFDAKVGKIGIKWNPNGIFNFTSSFSFAFQSTKLSKVIQEDLKGQGGEYAVYIEDLTDGESYGFNQFEQFPSASLYKLYLMAAVVQKIGSGGLSYDTKISSTKTHLTKVFGEVDYGYEDSDENIVYTVREALERIGRISDNFASVMLAEEVGWDQVQKMAEALNAQSTTIKSPINTSASDIGIFFKKLHLKQIVSPEFSDDIVNFLSLNKINNRIPSKLPEEVKIVHKTGELSRIRHDGGIVYLASRRDTPGAYVIVLMSRNLPYEDEGVDLLARISKDVYEYFINKYKETN